MGRLSEAEIIQALAAGVHGRRDVVVGIGDDGAVLAPPAGRHLVSVLDTLNEGIHFPAGTDAAAVGHRALAVNLSDMAAMGAEPAWAGLSLSLAEPDGPWIRRFAEGFHSLAVRWGVALIGGDTVRGPLSVAVHLMGFVAPGAMLTRCGARPGDRVYVTGAPGEAMAGLQRLLADPDVPSSHLTRRFLWPEPRVAEGGDLSGLASAAIDLSDGLATDLGRIAEASGVRVVIEVEDLPQSEEMKAAFGPEAATDLVITGGDDYELAFTMPPDREAELLARAAGWSCSLSRIGHVEAGVGLTFRRDGRPFSPDTTRSWRHFQGDLR